MPIRKDPSGERSVEAEVEVPGTPEEVWRAIATGKGISSWLVPSTSDERAGGTATCNFGPGMESVAAIKTWNPPHSFVAETEEEPGKVATEWIVEAKSGGTCIVRVVHRWFASTDDWDDQFIGHTYGWQAFFRILSLYLAHFSGQPCSAFQALGFSSKPVDETWQTLRTALGLGSGPQVKTKAGAPILSGVVERAVDPPHPEVLVRLDGPAPGIAHLFAMAMGGQVLVSVRFYLYGEQAANAIGPAEQEWTAWLAREFPADGMAECLDQ